MKIKLWIIGCFCFVLANNNWSQDFSTLGEIYNYDVGNEFHSIHYYCCNDISFQLRKVIIKEKIQTESLINYVTELSVFDFINTTPPILSDTSIYRIADTISILYPDSIIFRTEDTVISSSEMYNGRKICIDNEVITNSIRVQKYVDGCGLAITCWKEYFSNQCCITDSLIYFVKDEEHWGKTLLKVNTIKFNEKVEISPNPASQEVTLRNPNPDLIFETIVICDSHGKISQKIEVDQLNHVSKMKVDISYLPGGLYFIYFSTNKGNFASSVIKQ